MLILLDPKRLEGMEQAAIVLAFGRLSDRERQRLLDRLAGATDWSQFRGYDRLDAALLALAGDLAEAEGWGEDAGERYLGQNVHPAALATPSPRAYIGGTGTGRPLGR